MLKLAISTELGTAVGREFSLSTLVQISESKSIELVLDALDEALAGTLITMVDKAPLEHYYSLIMASERIQRRIERLLDQVDEAADQLNWPATGKIQKFVLREKEWEGHEKRVQGSQI